MKGKIVVIGGGNNGRRRPDGTRSPYDMEAIDREIVALTGKARPHFLFLGHAQNDPEAEQAYFDTMRNIYSGIFGCECGALISSDLPEAEEALEWADIVYVGGGDTRKMLELWKMHSFERPLRRALERGAVLCGVSAGANCWFRGCSSDTLRTASGDPNAPLVSLECLGFVDAFFAPHCNDPAGERLAHMKESVKDMPYPGIGLTERCALEIVDGSWRLIRSGLDAYGVKGIWRGGSYAAERIPVTDDFMPMKTLLGG